MSAQWEMVARILLAAGLGALIGWDRETRNKPAGLRTVMLVSVASATFVIAALGADLRSSPAQDRARAMAAVAQGIGFLGAGAILQARGEVRWLTTAASLWAAAALGVAAALGEYLLAALCGFLFFATLRWVPVVERRWLRRRPNEERSDADQHRDDHQVPGP